MKLLGDPGYRLLSVGLAIGAAGLSACIGLAALAFMADDWLFANCPKYRNRSR